jgi:hypothetical protein
MEREFTNGTGRCPTGETNRARIDALKERLDKMEARMDALAKESEERCKQIEDAVTALDKESLTARLSFSSTLLVALISAIAAVVAQFIAAAAK